MPHQVECCKCRLIKVFRAHPRLLMYKLRNPRTSRLSRSLFNSSICFSDILLHTQPWAPQRKKGKAYRLKGSHHNVALVAVPAYVAMATKKQSGLHSPHNTISYYTSKGVTPSPPRDSNALARATLGVVSGISVAGRGVPVMQVPHPAGGTSVSGSQGAPVFCVPGANGISAGTPHCTLCHSMAKEAATAGTCGPSIPLSQWVLPPACERGCAAWALSMGAAAPAVGLVRQRHKGGPSAITKAAQW